LCIKEDTCACDVGFQGNQCNQPVKKGNAIYSCDSILLNKAHFNSIELHQKSNAITTASRWNTFNLNILRRTPASINLVEINGFDFVSIFTLQAFVASKDAEKLDAVTRTILAFAEKDILVIFVKRHVCITMSMQNSGF
jgi:hypothetical protein